MDALYRFLEMGGYARFVWPAYGLAAVLLASMAVQSYRTWRRQHSLWSALEAMRPQRRR
jgi:heme exporter protein D